MSLFRGTLTAFDAATGFATVRLDGSSPVSLTGVRASYAFGYAALIAGRKVIIDAGDHGDPADAVVIAVFSGSATPFPGEAMQPPKFQMVPDLSRYPFAIRYDNTADPAGAIWPAANRALFVPFEVDQPVTVANVLLNVTTSGGNYDVGVYDQAGARLWNKGAGAVPAAGVVIISVSPALVLARGRYFFAVVCDGTVAAIQRLSGAGASLGNAQMWGLRQQATAYPLPATATPAAPATLYIPTGALEFS